jgi:hypothetical protein
VRVLNDVIDTSFLYPDAQPAETTTDSR